MGEFTVNKDVLRRYVGDGCRVEIPDGITYIESGAFADCVNLNEIVIPDSVTSIGEKAFCDTAYYNDGNNWENGVLYVGKHLIEARDVSGKYAIKAGTRVIADCAFSTCGYLTEIELPEGLTDIGSRAFSRCWYLEKAVIPDSVRIIGNRAFENCARLTDIVISDNVRCVERSAFDGTGYYKDGANWENGVLYVGAHLIEARGRLKGSYTVRAGTRTVTEEAFKDQSELTEILLPREMTYIGQEAFGGCRAITEFTVPDGLIYLENNTFAECSSLSRVSLPDGLERIGGSAFCGCSSLTEVVLPRSLRYIGECAFAVCSELKAAIIPDGVTEVDANAFYGCRAITRLSLSDSLERIGYKAFYGCESLTHVDIPESVTLINEAAFGCAPVEEFTVAPQNTAYKTVDGSLYTADGRTVIAYAVGRRDERFSVPDGVKEIGDSAFEGCSSLERVTLPDGVTRIGHEAFCGCDALNTVEFPEGLLNVQSHAFLNTAYYGDPANWTDGALYLNGCLLCVRKEEEPSGAYAVKEGVEVIADGTFSFFRKMTDVLLPRGLRSIGEKAFAHCSSLKGAVIPEGVRVISRSAFASCSAIREIVIPDSVEIIGKYAFEGCGAVERVTVGAEGLHLLKNVGEGIYHKALFGILNRLADGEPLSYGGKKALAEELDRADDRAMEILLSDVRFIVGAVDSAVISVDVARRSLDTVETPEVRARLLGYINGQNGGEDPFGHLHLGNRRRG